MLGGKPTKTRALPRYEGVVMDSAVQIPKRAPYFRPLQPLHSYSLHLLVRILARLTVHHLLLYHLVYGVGYVVRCIVWQVDAKRCVWWHQQRRFQQGGPAAPSRSFP